MIINKYWPDVQQLIWDIREFSVTVQLKRENVYNKRLIKMSLFIKCTLRWQIWTNKKLLLVLFLCSLNGKFWRQFDKQITVSSPTGFNVFSHMRLHGSPVAWTKWRFSTYYIDAHIQAFSSKEFRIIYPSLFVPRWNSTILLLFSFFFSL